MFLYTMLQIGHPPPLPQSTCTLWLGRLCGAQPCPFAFDDPQVAPPLPLCSQYLGPEEQWQEAG